MRLVFISFVIYSVWGISIHPRFNSPPSNLLDDNDGDPFLDPNADLLEGIWPAILEAIRAQNEQEEGNRSPNANALQEGDRSPNANAQGGRNRPPNVNALQEGNRSPNANAQGGRNRPPNLERGNRPPNVNVPGDVDVPEYFNAHRPAPPPPQAPRHHQPQLNAPFPERLRLPDEFPDVNLNRPRNPMLSFRLRPNRRIERQVQQQVQQQVQPPRDDNANLIPLSPRQFRYDSPLQVSHRQNEVPESLTPPRSPESPASIGSFISESSNPAHFPFFPGRNPRFSPGSPGGSRPSLPG